MPKKKTEETKAAGIVLHEPAIEHFLQVEKEYKEMEEFITSGKFLSHIFSVSKGDLAKAEREWQSIWARLRDLIDAHNTSRRSAADALRQVVVLAPTQWRGPEGTPSVVSCGCFKATSATGRSFDAKSLFNLLGRHGLQERLLTVTKIDQNGKEVPLVKQEWDIDYEGVLTWLRANKLDDVVQGAYEEKEMTPKITGPKEICFLGDRKS